MTYKAFFLTLTILLPVLQVNAEPLEIEPFTTDGCSVFPDGNLFDENKWLDCCVAHDLAYWQGGSYMERLKADQDLMSCVAKHDESLVSVIMLTGVRIGGSPFFPTTFRWGYGWPILRGYKPLSDAEKSMIKMKLYGENKEQTGF